MEEGSTTLTFLGSACTRKEIPVDHFHLAGTPRAGNDDGCRDCFVSRLQHNIRLQLLEMLVMRYASPRSRIRIKKEMRALLQPASSPYPRPASKVYILDKLGFCRSAMCARYRITLHSLITRL